ncbi:MAG: hypothetical protein EHM72_01865 [Calditrichaeota bacterium]|nr:MAG: hypothetical protein EHM72_01865 [Calditrichota bacterium]
MKRVFTVFTIFVLIISALLVFKRRNEKLEHARTTAVWNTIKNDTSLAGIAAFLNKHPENRMTPRIKNRFDSLRMEKAWKKALRSESADALLEFLSNFPQSPHGNTADSLLDYLQAELDGPKTQQQATSDAFHRFSDKDSGTTAVQAESLAIANEVAGILSKDHTTLPAAQRLSASAGDQNVIEIENQTRYNLTVRYSGPQSKRLNLPPRTTLELILPNGEYRVAASVNAGGIIPFAGVQRLEGGEYSSRYFIRGQ